MRILILTDRYPPFSAGGYELGCQEVVEDLKEKGHEVAVITTKYGLRKRENDAAIYRVLEYCNLNKLQNPGTYLIAQLKRAWMYRKNAIVLKMMLAKIKPDIVYGFQLWDVGLLAIKAVQKRGFTVIFDIQDYWLSDYRYKLLLRPNRTLRFMAALVNGVYDFDKLDFSHLYVISETLKMVYAQAGFRGAIKVIPRGIKLEQTQKLPHQERFLRDPVRLLYVGRLTAEKGPDIAIKAWGALAERFNEIKISLTIVGNGAKPYSDYLKKIADKFEFKDRVKFLGGLTRQDVFQEYKNNDILLFPSIWVEPLGVTVLEAMSCGLAVIATGQGGPAEIIQDRENGFLIKPGDYLGMAKIAQELIKNHSLYNRIIKSGYQTIIDKYDFSEAMRQTYQYLSGVYDRRPNAQCLRG